MLTDNTIKRQISGLKKGEGEIKIVVLFSVLITSESVLLSPIISVGDHNKRRFFQKCISLWFKLEKMTVDQRDSKDF